MSRLNILFLTQVLPYPLVGGPKIRAYYMLRHLAQQHEVTLVSFVRADDDAQAIAHLRDFCSAVHTVPISRSLMKNALSLLNSLLSQRPIVIVRDRIKKMEKKIEALVEERHSTLSMPIRLQWPNTPYLPELFTEPRNGRVSCSTSTTRYICW
jgi:hypothetical protein